MAEPIEVQAEVIEPAIVNLAKAPEPAITYTLPQVTIGNLSEVDAFIAGMEKYFADVKIDIYDKDQVKALKDTRADINKVADAIDKKRKAMNKEIKAASSEAENVLKGMHSRVKAIYDLMGKQMDQAEEERRQARYNILRREYEDLAPDLMELIPLESFLDREPKLLGATWVATKACKELGEMIRKAVHERDLIRESGIEFPNDADRVYCQTLDMAKAYDRNAQLVEERKQREAHMDAAARLDQAIGRAHQAVMGQSAPEPEPEPAPAQTQPEPAPTQTQPDQPVKMWQLIIECKRDDAIKVRDFMRTVPTIEGLQFNEYTGPRPQKKGAGK